MQFKTILTAACATAIMLSATQPINAGRKDDKKNAKISAYVKVINLASARAFENRRKLLAFEAKKKPLEGCDEKTSLSWPISSNGYTRSLHRDLKKTAKSKPRTKLDKAAMKMASALEALDAHQLKARDYYGKRKYKADQCKQAPSIHKGFHAALAAYITADAEIRAFVEQRNKARAGKELKKTKKKYGKRFRYFHQKLMIDAKAVLESVHSQPADKEFDMSLVAAAAKALSADLATLAPMVEKKRSQLDTFAYLRFYKKMVAFEKALVAYVERHGPDGKPYSDSEKKQLDRGSKSVKGSFPVVVAKYNQVVDQSNRLRFPPKVK